MRSQGSYSARTHHCICALFSLWRVHCVWYRCPPADPSALRAAVHAHAVADLRLHEEATARFMREWELTALPVTP